MLLHHTKSQSKLFSPYCVGSSTDIDGYSKEYWIVEDRTNRRTKQFYSQEDAEVFYSNNKDKGIA